MSHIFISYSRKDGVFTDKLVQALEARELQVWIDRKKIYPLAKWESEIYQGIEEADAFIFLFSPSSAISEMCQKEIRHAAIHNKLIIVVRILETGTIALPSPLSNSFNWIECREGEDDFSIAIAQIWDAIHKDYQWIKYQAKLEVKALEWERRAVKKDTSQLLSGRVLQEADQQIKAGRHKDPPPTDLQIQFVSESLKAEERRKKTMTGVSIGVLVVVFSLCIVAIAAGIYANFRSAVAAQNEDARSTAEAEKGVEATQRALAEAEAEAQTQVSRARELAQAATELRNTDPVLSLLLSVEAFKMADTYQTRTALFENAIASESQSIVRTFVGHEFAVKSVNFKLHNNTLESISIDGTAITWDLSTGEILSIEAGQRPEQDYGYGIHGDIFVRGEGNRVELFDVKTDKLIAHLAGHTGYVETIVFSPDDKKVATGSDDKSVILWDVYSGEIIVRLKGHTGRVFGVTFSTDGKKLASASEDGTVRVWNIESWSWMEEVCQRAGRNIQMPQDTSDFGSVERENYVAQDEWTRYFPGEKYRITCPQWPPENYWR